MKLVAINNKAVRRFKSEQDCARFLGVTTERVQDAVENRKHISGWFITTDKSVQSPMVYGSRIMVDGARYNPIFTRKPYSATGIWRKFDER